MSMLFAAAFAQTIVPTADIPDRTGDPCASIVNDRSGIAPQPRTITLEDQVKITDIGRYMPDPTPSPFGFSPDGEKVAVVVLTADPDSNAHCLRLLVMPTHGEGDVIEVDRGGEFIFDDFPLRDFMTVRAGWTKPYSPRWSPDGSKIAFLRRERQSTQVWLGASDGREDARQLSTLTDNVDAFAWTLDGSGIVVASRPTIRRAAEAIARQGRRGFLFDDRFAPQFADYPVPTGNAEYTYTLVSLEDGSQREATVEERSLLAPARPADIPEIARTYSAGPDGYAAWLEPKFPEQIISPTRLVIASPDGTKRQCDSPECEGIRDLWWSAEGASLFAQQVTGWATSRSALLRWDSDAPSPQRVLETDDAVVGCSPLGQELVCLREGSVQPRRMVAINMATGAERVLFDPNPALRAIRYGEVRRFRFRNAYGVETFADLVLPPDHRQGEQHPLVVVQYSSHGYLRGGTGDEVPIHPLAARGFAVLSFDRPSFLPEGMAATREADMRNGGRGDWADRRQVLSSLEMAVEHALATGAVDPARMGISGFSDGGGTAQFAMVNSTLFKVASMGSCCEDMYSFALAPGPVFADQLRERGYRYFEPGMEEFWRPMSLVLNADDIDIPLLLQIGDSEYEGALDVVEAWTHRGKAIELYVFPDGPHLKWQPAHREALYERNVEWFEFWLAGKRNCDPHRDPQYERWLAMQGGPERQDLECAAPYSSGP